MKQSSTPGPDTPQRPESEAGPEAPLPETPAYVLDTSAIFCLLNDEPGADQVDALLAAARASPAQASIAIPFHGIDGAALR